MSNQNQMKKVDRATRSTLAKKNSQENYNNSEAQRLRILGWLQKGQPLTTPQAREWLDVMHPAGRIMELRKRGYNITMVWVTDETAQGGRHRFAQYTLVAAK